ncbi:FAD-dependent oxidoreductase [Sedimentisphaera salicampi]|uniref:FAD dependent oxidoreductase n=1 Tax=Sedimentisphaera salicampi TaxID=1941349 RepID=A0A1W6LKA9_9BACT|nr:FAD-dependent oxidoreductase [Sedimentisphaera salicampi]ARN56186.1 FAD dependent oxidoreductase [Sedimentisphaera salicampi]
MTKNKVFAFLIVIYLAADLFASQNMIDFFSLPENGVKVLNNFSGKPQGKNGSLVTYDIRLPKFKNGVFTSADIARWPTDTNRCLSWVFENDFKSLFSEGIEKQTVYRKYKKHWLDRPNRESPFVLLQLNSGDYLALVPLAGPQNISWLYVNQDGELQVKAGTLGTDSVSGDVPLLAWRRSPDVYTACREAWEIAVNSESIKGRTRLRHEKDYPSNSYKSRRGLKGLGVWYWESGFNHDPFEKSEYIRDWNFRAMYGAWDTLKNVDKLHKNRALGWAAYISGKRESRRLMGDIILTKKDVIDYKWYDDALVPTGWKIDVHVSDKAYDKGFEGDAFISKALFTDYSIPYYVPYRCLYSRTIDNLFMAGRNISVTHEALGTVRVMRTCCLMGEVVGRAASLCRKYNAAPREVYHRHLKELLELNGYAKEIKHLKEN